MREKVKNILFIISVFYSIIVVILMCITISNMRITIELYDTEENKNLLNNYKEQLAKIESNECTKIINEIIKNYEDTSYDGYVNLREMYEYDMEKSILNYYLEARNKCKISSDDEKKYNLPIKFITTSIQKDELYQPYYFQYELGIKDSSIRLIAEVGLSNVEYKINRTTQLEIISSLIEISSKEDIINE